MDDVTADAYLARIGASREPPSAAALAALMGRHLTTVPFENLGIHLGERISLDEARTRVWQRFWMTAPAAASVAELSQRQRALALQILAEHPWGGLKMMADGVLRMMAAGKSNQEIADALFVSLGTVKVHVTHILAKLDVKSRSAATDYAHRHDLA